MATPPVIHKKDVILVKPAKPTPSEVLSFSSIDNDRNLEILCQTVYVYKAKGCSNHDDMDPALIIKEALSRALVYYHPLAGKLKRGDDGKLRVTCNADGVPFLDANAECELSSLNYFDGLAIEIAKLFAFDWPSDSDYGYHPLVLQVTKFSCGGFTIGMGLSHSVCDGFGAAQFFRAMAELASGTIEPSVKPVWEREKLVGIASEELIPFPIIDKACLATSPFLPTTDVVHECFYVDSESIRALKMSLWRDSRENECEISDENFTTIEILGAYVWRSKSRALQLNPDGKTLFFMAMGIRNLINPPLTAGYYGNAFMSSSHCTLTGRELDELPLYKVAKLIKGSKKVASTPDFVARQLDLFETILQKNLKVETNGVSMVLTDWRLLGLVDEVDIGGKEMVNMVPLPWKLFFIDLCLFVPPCKVDSLARRKGGVRVLVTLPEAAMARMKEEMKGLPLGGDSDIKMGH